MPMVRKQFEAADMDFRRPTKSGLKTVIDNLEKVSASLKGDSFAKDCVKKYRRWLRNID